MAEFKNKEDYDKWINEKQREQQPKPATQASVDDPKPNKYNHQEKSSKTKVLIFLVIGLLILLPATYFAWHYMTHGKLSGNVYVTMKSGDVKKAAGIEVMLIAVPNAEQTLKEIKKSKEDSWSAMLEVRASMFPLEDDAEILSRVEQHFKELANVLTGHWKDSFNEAASKSHDEFLEKRKKLEPYWDKMKALQTEHNKRVADLLSLE